RVIRRTLKRQEAVSLLGQSSSQRHDKSRLADTGLAGDQDDLAFTALRLAILFLQEAQFGLATDQGRQLKGGARLEATRCRTRCQDPPHMNGPLESLQVVIAEIGKFKQPAKQEPGAWSD